MDNGYHPITDTVEASSPPLVTPRTATDDLRDSAAQVIAQWMGSELGGTGDAWEELEMHLAQLAEAVRRFDVAAAKEAGK